MGVNTPVHYEMLVGGIHLNPQEGEECVWGWWGGRVPNECQTN